MRIFKFYKNQKVLNQLFVTLSILGSSRIQAGPILGSSRVQAGPILGSSRVQAGPILGSSRVQAGPILGWSRVQAGPILGWVWGPGRPHHQVQQFWRLSVTNKQPSTDKESIYIKFKFFYPELTCLILFIVQIKANHFFFKVECSLERLSLTY